MTVGRFVKRPVDAPLPEPTGLLSAELTRGVVWDSPAPYPCRAVTVAIEDLLSVPDPSRLFLPAPCGLKSALHSATGRGIHPAGAGITAARHGGSFPSAPFPERQARGTPRQKQNPQERNPDGCFVISPCGSANRAYPKPRARTCAAAAGTPGQDRGPPRRDGLKWSKFRNRE